MQEIFALTSDDKNQPAELPLLYSKEEFCRDRATD